MRKLNLIDLALVVSAFILLSIPFLVFTIDKSFFYGIDPGIVYVTNAILYAKAGLITYLDHPGTPSIMLLNYLFIPMRLFVKFVLDQNFIDWSFNNFSFLFLLIRFFQISLVSLSLWIFLRLTNKITNSKLVVLVAFFLLFCFSGITLGSSIVPENLSHLLTVVWLIFFVKYLQKSKYYLNMIMVFIAGIVLANKFTGIFLLFASIIFPFFTRRVSFYEKFMKFEANIALAVQSFVIGIWPVINNITTIFNWAKSLVGHSNIHGTGEASVFNLQKYSESLFSLINGYPLTAILVLLTLFMGIFLVIKKKIEVVNPVFILTITSFLGVLIFSKYSLIHYNYVNILLLIFCFVFYLSKLSLSIMKLAVLVSFILFLTSSYGYVSGVITQIDNNKEGDVYVVLKDWTRYWSSNVFEEQFNKANKP